MLSILPSSLATYCILVSSKCNLLGASFGPFRLQYFMQTSVLNHCLFNHKRFFIFISQYRRICIVSGFTFSSIFRNIFYKNVLIKMFVFLSQRFSDINENMPIYSINVSYITFAWLAQDSLIITIFLRSSICLLYPLLSVRSLKSRELHSRKQCVSESGIRQ